MWASDLRPDSLQQNDVDQTDSPESFTLGPGVHAQPGYAEARQWAPKKWGKWKTDFGTAPGFAGEPDGKGGWKGRDDVLNNLAGFSHMAPGRDDPEPDVWKNSFADMTGGG